MIRIKNATLTIAYIGAPKSSPKLRQLKTRCLFKFLFLLHVVAIFCSFSKPPLFLVSLDGFRAEYLKDHSGHIPVISKLRKSTTELIPELVVVFGQLEEWQTTTFLQERLGPQRHNWGPSILQRPSPTITALSLWVVVFICEVQKFTRLNTAAKRYFTSKMTFPFRLDLQLSWIGAPGTVKLWKYKNLNKYTKSL